MRRRGALTPTKKLVSRAVELGATILPSGALAIPAPAEILRRERLFCRHPRLAGLPLSQTLEAKKADGVFQKILKRILAADPEQTFGYFGGCPVEVYSNSPAHSLAARLLLENKHSPGLLGEDEQAIRIYHDAEASPADFGVSLPLDRLALFDLSERRALLLGAAHPSEIAEALATFAHLLLPQRGILSLAGRATCDAKGQATCLMLGEGSFPYLNRHRRLLGHGTVGWSKTGLYPVGAAGQVCLPHLHPSLDEDFWATLEGQESLLAGAALESETSLLARTGQPAHAVGSFALAKHPYFFSGQAAAPSAVVFFCADPLGALPALARLTAEQARYHFLSGYGAGGGTLFRACFGSAEAVPHLASQTADLLYQRVKESDASVWLVNVAPGHQKMPVEVRRAFLDGILSGTLSNARFMEHPTFGFQIPLAFEAIDSHWLKAPEGAAVEDLARRYLENYKKFPSSSGWGGPAR